MKFFRKKKNLKFPFRANIRDIRTGEIIRGAIVLHSEYATFNHKIPLVFQIPGSVDQFCLHYSGCVFCSRSRHRLIAGTFKPV